MRKAILFVSIFLILVGLTGIVGGIMTFSALTQTGGSPGGFPIPIWVKILIAYQALLPLAIISAGGALILLEKKYSSSKTEK